MMGRRLIAGILAAGCGAAALGASALASGPRPRPAQAAQVVALPLTASRALSRASSTDDNPTAQPSTPPAASQPSPDIRARARAVFDANRAGKIDRSQYSDRMNERIDDKALAAAASQLDGLGSVKSFIQVRKITQGARTVYVFRVDFANGAAVEQAIAWDGAGKVDFLQFAPAR